MKSFVKLFAFIVSVGIGTFVANGCTNHHYSKPGFSVAAPVHARVGADLEIGGPVEGVGEASTIIGMIRLPFSAEYADGVSYGASAAGGAGGGIGALLFGGGASDSDKAKSIAAYNAVKEGDYDIVLGARYHVVIDDLIIMTNTKATVWGWGAKVKGVKQLAPRQ